MDHIGPGGKGKGLRERTDRGPIGNGGRVVGGDDETPRTIAVNGAEHESEDRVRASRLEAEAAHEVVSDFALPVDVRPGGHACKPDRSDDLTSRDPFADAHVD